MRQEEMTNTGVDYIIAGMNTDYLTEWEKSFFESVSEQWEKHRKLSEKQKEVLGRIWDKQP